MSTPILRAVQPQSAPTVLIAVHQGFAARYLLRTEVLETLLGAGIRVVVLTPNWDEPYMVEELGARGVMLEPLRVSGTPKGSRLWGLFFYLRQFTLAGGHRARTLQGRYLNHRDKLRRERPLAGRLTELALAGLWRSRLLRRALVALEGRLFAPDAHQDVFDRHRPDLVVTVSPGWFLSDAVVLREARRNGVRTAAVVMAWDNPTSKGYRGARPDRVIAWSEAMAQQLVRFHDLPRNIVEVGGVPHFDPYARVGDLMSREELFARLGLDPEHRLVCFAARSPSSFGRNLVVAETLAKAVTEDTLGAPAQLVIRPHPINFRLDHGGPVEGYGRLAQSYAHVHIDTPEVQSQRLHCDMPTSDSLRFGSLLKHCDVLVNAFSTTTLEAFLLDRPVVVVSADIDSEPDSPTEPDAAEPRRFQDDTHSEGILASRAARMARNPAELVELVRFYLESPEADHDARESVGRRECGPVDGRSGERVGRLLLAQLPASGLRPLAPDRPDLAPAGGAS